MRKQIRVLIAVFGAAAFAGAAAVYPAMLEPTSIRTLLAIYAAVSALWALFYRRFHATTGEGALSAREMDRFTMRRDVIRGRMWTVAGFSALCAIIIWLFSLFAPPASHPHWFSFAVGFFASVGVVYCLTIVRWIDDLDSFSDKLRLIQERKRQDEAMLKRLTERKNAVT